MKDFTEYTYTVRVRVDDNNARTVALISSEAGEIGTTTEMEFGDPRISDEIGEKILADVRSEQFGEQE